MIGHQESAVRPESAEGLPFCLALSLPLGGHNFSRLEAQAIVDAHLDERRIGITNDDPAETAFIENGSPAIIGTQFCKYDNNEKGSVQYHFNSKEWVPKYYEQWGMRAVNSPLKELGIRGQEWLAAL